MGIDYIIHYGCEPKRALTTEGILERLKGRDRALKIIELYRQRGDDRPPARMGFEMVRRLPDGAEETQIVVVQDLLDAAGELEPWEPYCAGCPANRAGRPFGCIGTINYPISARAERWLLEQLPDNDEPLPYMLLQKALQEMGYTGTTAASLRQQTGVFFEGPHTLVRDFGGFTVSGDQVFELLFLSGPIRPAHATLLLQFFGGIPRDLEADTIMQLAVPPSQEWIDEHTPLLVGPRPTDDESTVAIKEFLHALHIGYRLAVPVLLDV
ncbi:MAG: hypothetical protein GXY36_05660 [Chloroflexi bacterium]|nr:hypothetical protein [Chloroflexota bacterium]